MSTNTPTIRDLMPEGFLPLLAARTGCRQPTTLSQVVRYESTSSKYWPAVEELARETNPEGLAKWQAAHPELASIA